MEALQRNLFGDRVAGRSAKTYNHAIGQDTQVFFTRFSSKLVAATGAKNQAISALLQRVKECWAEQWPGIVGGRTPHTPYLACLKAIEHKYNVRGVTVAHRLLSQ